MSLKTCPMLTPCSALAKKYAAEVAAAEPKLPSPATTDPKPKPEASTSKRVPPKSGKKDMKSLLKGVVVKKKPTPSSAKPASGSKRQTEDDQLPDKKRKL